jgi:serine/threonine protein phosphatase PrpC
MNQVSCGCSAILALTLGNRLYVASAGDSRAVLLRNLYCPSLFAGLKKKTNIKKIVGFQQRR